MKFNTIKIDIRDHNVFFTSDTHFHHANIIKYCNRPFNHCKEMDSVLIDNWNSVVGPDDYVFHAGDFCFGSKNSWHSTLIQLNGKKYLAAGNHDLNITPEHFMDVQQMFNIRILGDPEIASDGQRITVCHYPMFSWYQSHRGSWNTYGHHHGTLSNKGLDKSILSPNQLDVGVDVHEYTPISYERVKEIITKQNLEK